MDWRGLCHWNWLKCNFTMQAVVTCLVATIPSIGNACLVTLVILLVFAILGAWGWCWLPTECAYGRLGNLIDTTMLPLPGMELFLGKLHHCTSSTCCILESCTVSEKCPFLPGSAA